MTHFQIDRPTKEYNLARCPIELPAQWRYTAKSLKRRLDPHFLFSGGNLTGNVGI
jgi:hypothetical protein